MNQGIKKFNKNKWLKSGPYSVITSLIKGLAKELKGRDDHETLLNISHWLRNQKYLPKKRKKLWHQRSAEQILRDEFFTGCGDYALVGVTLLRAMGIPSKFAQVVSKNWLLNKPSKIKGHSLVEVFIKNKWHIFDPLKGELWPNYSLAEFVVYKKGIDFEDIGIKNLKNLKSTLDEFKRTAS